MSDLTWQLPGIKAFVDAITDDLGSGSSVVVHTAPTAIASLREAVETKCRREFHYLDWVNLDAKTIDCSSHANMAASIRHEICRGGESPGCLDQFSNEIEDHVIWISEVQSNDWERWRSFVEEVRLRNHSKYESERGMLCIQLPSNLDAPQSDLGLSVRCWRGVVREIDSRILIELSQAGVHSSLGSSIRNAMAIELGGTDLELVRYLANKSADDLAAPTDALLAYAEQKLWLAKARDCWESGGSDMFRQKSFVHSCKLAIDQQTKELNARVWRAQISTVFPAIEQRRIERIQEIAPFLSETRLADHQGNPADLEDLELGSIVHFLHRTRVSEKLKSEFTTLRDVRHELAHLRPASGHLLNRLLDLLGSKP